MEGLIGAPHRGLGAQVRSAFVGDRTIVLCLETGMYFGLGPVATRFWRGLSDRVPASDTCSRVAATYGLPVDVVESDYAEFIENVTRRGWLAFNSRPAPPRPRRPTRLRKQSGRRPGSAWTALALMSIWLKGRGFASAYRYASDWSERELTPHGSLAEALERFRSAEGRFVSLRGPDDCLDRSLALFVFLRRAGFAVCHRIGVCDSPVTAHAWVDYDGQVLLEDPERVARFTVIASLP